MQNAMVAFAIECSVYFHSCC